MKKLHFIQWALPISLLFFLTTTSQVMARGYTNSADVMVEVISDERGYLNKFSAGFGNKYAERSYVAARDNERYRIRIHNRSEEQIGLVIAVDGRNIISGRKSHLNSQERMYILGPYETAEYDGWRTGRNRVNRFYFTGMSDSYAAAWGDYSAMGVIAVAAYKSHYRDMSRHKKKPKYGPMDRPRSNARRQDPGTGFGETQWSPSKTVQFSPRKEPFTKKFIKYEWRSTLCKIGIIECRNKRIRREWNRFWPGHLPGYGFAPYPPAWRYR